MNRLPSSVARPLIRLTYLLPAISGVILLIYACVPHLFFLYQDVVYETLSPFQLIANTWNECSTILGADSKASAEAVFFAYTMMFFAVLFWIAVIIYTITASASAITSCIAFASPPTSKESNRAKRWMRFFCPGRVLYVVSNLILLLAAAFPHILLYFYQRQLGYFGMTLHFFGPSDLLLAAILILLQVAAFLALLPLQARVHMDMFRLYKAKKD